MLTILVNGDCGSWVFDLKTGDIYGHIVSGFPGTGTAYIVPASQIFQDIRRSLGKSVELFTPGSKNEQKDAETESKFPVAPLPAYLYVGDEEDPKTRSSKISAKLDDCHPVKPKGEIWHKSVITTTPDRPSNHGSSSVAIPFPLQHRTITAGIYSLKPPNYGSSSSSKSSSLFSSSSISSSAFSSTSSSMAPNTFITGEATQPPLSKSKFYQTGSASTSNAAFKRRKSIVVEHKALDPNPVHELSHRPGYSLITPSPPSSPGASKHGSVTNEARAIQGENRVPTTCTNCFTQTTPLWRRNQEGHPLCNACGLFLKLHGVVRPISLKVDVIKKRIRGSGASLLVGKSGGASTRDDSHLSRSPLDRNAGSSESGDHAMETANKERRQSYYGQSASRMSGLAAFSWEKEAQEYQEKVQGPEAPPLTAEMLRGEQGWQASSSRTTPSVSGDELDYRNDPSTRTTRSSPGPDNENMIIKNTESEMAIVGDASERRRAIRRQVASSRSTWSAKSTYSYDSDEFTSADTQITQDSPEDEEDVIVGVAGKARMIPGDEIYEVGNQAKMEPQIPRKGKNDGRTQNGDITPF